MVCVHCGQELNENDTICSKCGEAVNPLKIQITYEDENVEYVDPPVITEAHTFIDEENFAKKMQEARDAEEEEEDVSSHNPLIWAFVFLLVAIIGGVVYFAFFSHIPVKTSNVVEESFSSEEWTSGEFMIDGDLYKLNQTFSRFYQKGWNLENKDITTIEGTVTTDLLPVVSSFDEKHIVRIQLTNPTEKALKVEDCIITGVMVEADSNAEFTLPGQIMIGSKELEIQSLYGKLEETQIVRDESIKASIYQYRDQNKNLDLTIYDEGGLKSFHFYR